MKQYKWVIYSTQGNGGKVAEMVHDTGIDLYTSFNRTIRANAETGINWSEITNTEDDCGYAGMSDDFNTMLYIAVVQEIPE